MRRLRMKTAVGFWDSLFGERITVELPLPDGTIRSVRVTKKWLQDLEGRKLARNVTATTVRVNILDPLGRLHSNDASDVRIEYHVIGKTISEEQYAQFVDSETKELYAIVSYEDGKPPRFFLERALWEKGRRDMENAGT
jgi:hypothetical protein